MSAALILLPDMESLMVFMIRWYLQCLIVIAFVQHNQTLAVFVEQYIVAAEQ